MIEKTAKTITKFCLKDRFSSDDDFEVIAYGIECLLSDTIQIALLLLLGAVLGILAEVITFAICFTNIKKRMGGYHANSHFACTATYTSISSMVCLLIRYSAINLAIPIVILYLICIVVIFSKSPVVHKNMPRSQQMTEKQWHIGKVTVLVFAVVLPSLYFIFPSAAIAGGCGVIFATINQLTSNKED